MTGEEFAGYLEVATQRALEFGQRFVVQELADHLLYKLFPNQSFDGELVGDEVVYPQDSLEEGQFLGPLTAADVVEYLWRDGKVPEWIDITIESVAGGTTHLQLLCCGRYTAIDEYLYYTRDGTGPFSLKGPCVPPGWDSLETSGRFDLHWWDDSSK